MSRLLSCIVLAGAVCAGPALAASAPVNPAAAPPAATPPPAATSAPSAATGAVNPAPAAATGAAADANATASTVTPGLTVKDNTGAAIGHITAIAPDASGAQMATIKMGADTFTVAASSLAVDNGAAVINLTGAQLHDMLHKPAS
jgi:hypothetical protein